MLSMALPFFIEPQRIQLSPALVTSIIRGLNDSKSSKIRNLSIDDYCNGVRSWGNEENGVYFMRFQDNSYYIGAAASCTMLERLSKHLDGRAIGRSNRVLKNLGKDNLNSDYFLFNMEILLEAKILLLPVSSSKLIPQKAIPENGKKLINYLEEDFIFLFHKEGISLKNKRIPKKLSNVFLYEI